MNPSKGKDIGRGNLCWVLMDKYYRSLLNGEEKNDLNQERASSISEARVKPRKLESKIEGRISPERLNSC